MAKSNKKRKGTRRRRRVGALSPSSPMVKIGAVALGYFLTAIPVNGMIDKVSAGKLDSKIIGAGEVGLGALLLLSKKPSLIKTIAGGVAAGAGVKRLLSSFGIGPAATIPAVTGYGKVPVIGGYGQVPVIGNRGKAAVNGHLGAYTPSGTLGSYAIRSGQIGRVMGSVEGSTLLGNN